MPTDLAHQLAELDDALHQLHPDAMWPDCPDRDAQRWSSLVNGAVWAAEMAEDITDSAERDGLLAVASENVTTVQRDLTERLYVEALANRRRDRRINRRHRSRIQLRASRAAKATTERTRAVELD